MGAHHAGGGQLQRMVLLVGPLHKKPRARCRMQLFGLCTTSAHSANLIFCLCSVSVLCLGWLEEKRQEHVPRRGCLLHVSPAAWATTLFPTAATSCPALNARVPWGHAVGHTTLTLAAS